MISAAYFPRVSDTLPVVSFGNFSEGLVSGTKGVPSGRKRGSTSGSGPLISGVTIGFTVLPLSGSGTVCGHPTQKTRINRKNV